MAYQLSLGRVLKRDWPSFGLALFIGACWLIAIAGYAWAGISQTEGNYLLAHFMGGGAVLMTAVFGPVLAWRIRDLRRVFARGDVVQGRVLTVGENSEYIEHAVIAYQHGGREYRVTNVTEGVLAEPRLAPGAAVDIVVDPGKPSRAFIVKLYIDK